MTTTQLPQFRQEAAEVAIEMTQLKRDMKRLLSMQWKEFIHFVHDQPPMHCTDAVKADKENAA